MTTPSPVPAHRIPDAGPGKWIQGSFFISGVLMALLLLVGCIQAMGGDDYATAQRKSVSLVRAMADANFREQMARVETLNLNEDQLAVSRSQLNKVKQCLRQAATQIQLPEGAPAQTNWIDFNVVNWALHGSPPIEPVTQEQAQMWMIGRQTVCIGQVERPLRRKDPEAATAFMSLMTYLNLPQIEDSSPAS